MKSILHRIFLPLSLAAVLVSLASCSGVKNLRKPSLNMPQSVVAGEIDSLSYADLKWWEYYTDPTLKTLIARAVENNRDLLIASARVEEMRRRYRR